MKTAKIKITTLSAGVIFMLAICGIVICAAFEAAWASAPVLNPMGDISINEGELLTFKVIASDADGNSLSLTAANLPDGADFTDNHDGTGTFTWTPNSSQGGLSYEVSFTVSDGQLSDTKTTKILVFDCIDNVCYRPDSPHWAHINVLDLGRPVAWFPGKLPWEWGYIPNDPNNHLEQALDWYAANIDVKEVQVNSFLYNYPDHFKTSNYLKSKNPTIKTYGYDADLYMCQTEGCNWDSNGRSNNNFNALPEDYYLHFSTDTTIQFYTYDWLGNGERIPSGDPVVIPGCSQAQFPDVNSCKNSRLQALNWQDRLWLPNLKSSGWQTWFASHLLDDLNGTTDPNNVVDGVYLDDSPTKLYEMFSGWGNQAVILNSDQGGGKIREYSDQPLLNNIMGNYSQLDSEYNNDGIVWLQYLRQRLETQGKFVFINTSLTDDPSTNSGLAAKGALTEHVNQADGFISGITEYQTYIDAANKMSKLPGAFVEAFGTDCQYAPAWDDGTGDPELGGETFNPGNYIAKYPDSQERWWMWRLASYYVIKEPAASPGKVYFDPNLCLESPPGNYHYDFAKEWLPVYEMDIGQPVEEKGYLYQHGDKWWTYTAKYPGGWPCGDEGIGGYNIYARHYNKNGSPFALVLVRPQGKWQCLNYGDTSQFPIQFTNQDVGRYYHLLRGDATLGPLTNNFSLRNAEAAILLYNRAPVVGTISDQTVSANQLLTFDVTASDPDNDSLTLSAENQPAGANFIDNHNGKGTFSWTPNSQQVGVYAVTFKASDSDASLDVYKTSIITVTGRANNPPVLNPIGNKTVNEVTTLSFTVTASDPDGDTLTYSATGLPSGATFNATTKTFSWTPSYSQAGSYSVKFTVSDGSLTDYEDVLISVINVNQAPILNPIGNKSVNENSLLSFTISGSDPDGDTLAYSAAGLPSEASLNAATGAFSWTPTYDQAGSYSVTFTVSDGNLADSEVVAITVANVNRAPTSTSPGNKTVDENVLMTFTFSASDPDGDILAYSQSGAAGAAIDASGKFTWIPSFTQAGTYTVTLKATDPGGLSTSQAITIAVNNINRAPVLDPIGNKSVNENYLLTFTISGSDPDGDTLTYAADSLPTGASFNASTKTFSWTPSYAQAGSYQVTFKVSDGNLEDSEAVTITVTNVNQAPVLDTIGSKAVDENQLLTFTVSASDPDADTLTYSANPLPSGAIFNAATKTFAWTPGYDQSGSYTVKFAVSDGKGGSDEEDVIITVNNVNRAPVLNVPGGQQVISGQTLSFIVTASDPDNDAITLSCTNLPSGARFDVNNSGTTGTFTWIATTNTVLHFEAKDVKATVSGDVSVNVMLSTDQYQITLNPITDKTVNEGQLLSFSVSATDSNPNAHIVITTSALPSGATFADKGNGTGDFNWTPTYEQAKNYTVTFIASDGSLSASRTITISVNNVNRAPTLTSTGDKTAKDNELLSFKLSASDPDGDSLTYSSANLPSGASLNANTGEFNWTPNATQIGNYKITFTVSDGNLTDAKDAAITVAVANAPPALNRIGDKSVKEGSALTFTVTAIDPDQDILTFSTNPLPQGATFINNTFSWTPTYDQAGSYSVTFTVSDGKAEASETINIAVSNVNRSPVLNPIGEKTVVAGELLTFSLSATDPDGDNLSYSATNLPSGANFDSLRQIFTWTPTTAQTGKYSLHFEVNDGSLKDSEDVAVTVVIRVGGIDYTLTLNPIGDKTVVEGSLLSFAVSAFSSDPNGQILLSAWGLPSGATFEDKGNGRGNFNWTPENTGEYPVHFEAKVGAVIVSEDITITVTSANAPPALNRIGDKSVKEGSTLTFTVTAMDPDQDILTYSASGLSQGATFINNTFSWTPDYGQAGIYPVTFTVSDGKAEASEAISIIVTQVNQPPQLFSIGNKQAVKGELLTFTVAATDPDGDKLTYSTSNLPKGAKFDTEKQIFTWKPEKLGVYNGISFTVKDTSGAKDSEAITIWVTDKITATVIIKNLKEAVSLNSTTISWDTNMPVSSKIEYGATITYGSTTQPEADLKLNHQVILTNLLPGTNYHYRIISTDKNKNSITSRDCSFYTQSTLNNTLSSNIKENKALNSAKPANNFDFMKTLQQVHEFLISKIKHQ